MAEHPHEKDHNCIHEELLQDHNLKIGQLETKATYKEEAIVELKQDMKIMNEKLDKVLDGFNDLKNQSKIDDKELELRLTAIETRLDANEKARDSDNQRTLRIISVVGILLAILTFYFNFIK